MKPTQQDMMRIRAAAGLEVRRDSRRIHLEVGERWNCERPEVQPSINALLVTAYPEDYQRDTDLSEIVPLSTFANGPLPLTAAREGIFDFYIYERAPRDAIGELLGNVIAYYHNGQLTRITGAAKDTLWSKRS